MKITAGFWEQPVAVKIFFTLQVMAIFVGLFTTQKHFNWVPYDELTNYTITVHIGKEQLSKATILARYHRKAAGRENRSVHNLITLVKQYESTYGKNDSAHVVIKYKINGKYPRYWSWPDDQYGKDR